jgi:hypothetical protein
MRKFRLTQKRPSEDGRLLFSLKAGSRLVDTFLERILGLADRLLGLAFAFLHHAFGTQFIVAGGFADALFDVAGGFIGHAFDFIACAAHGDSPVNISMGRKVVTQG